MSRDYPGTHKVSIVAPAPSPGPSPGGTKLSSIAAAMSPGQWKQLTGADKPSGLGLYNNQNGNSGILTSYSWTMARDAARKQILFVGADHNDVASLVTFDEATHACTAVKPPWGAPTKHGYCQNVFDSKHGKFYFRKSVAFGFWRRDGDNTWADVVYDGLNYKSAANGCTFFPDLGPNGSIIVFQVDNGTNGGCVAYDPVTNVSQLLGSGSKLANVGDPHNFALYNPDKKCAWVGGGNGSVANWRIDPSGEMVKMADVPSALLDGATIGPGMSTVTSFYNPGTKGFTVMRKIDNWWNFDSNGSGSWTRRTDTNPLLQGEGDVPGYPAYGIVHAPLPEYGAVFFIRVVNRSSEPACWLWKAN